MGIFLLIFTSFGVRGIQKGCRHGRTGKGSCRCMMWTYQRINTMLCGKIKSCNYICVLSQGMLDRVKTWCLHLMGFCSHFPNHYCSIIAIIILIIQDLPCSPCWYRTYCRYRLASLAQRSACLCFLNVGMKGLLHKWFYNWKVWSTRGRHHMKLYYYFEAYFI